MVHHQQKRAEQWVFHDVLSLLRTVVVITPQCSLLRLSLMATSQQMLRRNKQIAPFPTDVLESIHCSLRKVFSWMASDQARCVLKSLHFGPLRIFAVTNLV